MKRNAYLVVLIPLIWACSSDKKIESASLAEMGADTVLSATDTAAELKVIRTADLRMRVGNALQTKQAVVAELQRQGGLTIESELNRVQVSNERMRQSADSLMEVSSFYYEGRMKVSVPAPNLDEFLNHVQGMAVYIEQESMKRDDQQLTYLENSLTAANRKVLLDMTAKKKLSRQSDVYSAALMSDDYVKRKIDNMKIDQQVRFSTVVLAFYESNSISRVTVANDNLANFRPPFFSRLWLNMASGWIMFKELLLLLAHLWMLPVLGLITYIVLKRVRKTTVKTAGS
ncbi:hypothetical protein [Pedobacter sp. SYP-B3415]|uniref:hypothetical protein n=1 Tax=Pedobacter sp. SYP-B3415 TaxID=2496641 RepID=UPI0013EB96E7|nr:hypothetical protein [Pedobacter sp. SYP-B3415]